MKNIKYNVVLCLQLFKTEHISTLGRSVVDYAIVQADCLNKYANFQVRTMLDLLEEYSDSSVPDHSL